MNFFINLFSSKKDEKNKQNEPCYNCPDTNKWASKTHLHLRMSGKQDVKPRK